MISTERRSILLDALLAGVLLVLARTDWAMQSVYHSNFVTSEVVGAMAVLGGGFTLLLTVVGAVGGPVGAWAVRCTLMLIACYILQGPLRAAGWFGQTPLTALEKAAILLALVLVASALTARLAPPTWRRLRGALAAAAVIYALSPFALVGWMAPPLRVDLRAFAPETADDRAPSATLVVLLDEWAAARAEDVAGPLRAAGAQVQSAVLQSAGYDTIDVVPQMLGSSRLTNVRVCTPSALCANDAVFDFARLAFAREQRVHVVGMFHPYCAIDGWRSCHHADFTGEPALRHLACSFLRLLPAESLACDPLPLDDWRQFRARLLAAVRNSPFWADGGTLFAHVPLPHPPDDKPGGSLRQDYDDNLGAAGSLIAELWSRARERFGDDVQLILTSDHTLRPGVWCRSWVYAREGCTVPPAWTDGRVPMVVASGRPFRWQPPTGNAGVFAAQPR